MADPTVRVKLDERAGGAVVGTVTVDNQRKLNCLSTATNVAIKEAFDRLSAEPRLRVVILTGAGERAFIGGADLNELGAACTNSSRLYITKLHEACKSLRDCPVPVIARVNGFCLGAGFEIAASADMRVAAATAVLGMPEVVMGLPSVIEAALLPGLIGWGKTREILLTGETFSAHEAKDIGFVQKVVALAELDAAVEHWVEHILRATPMAIRAQKALMNRWERVSVDEAIYAGIDALSDAYKTGEPQAAIKAFFDAKKR
jgi:enoyl-CoA hydratase/carnithine racemase